MWWWFAIGILLALVCLRGPEPYGSGEAFGSTTGHAMVIVEPRRHHLLRHVLSTFDAKMPPRYDLYIFHGKDNEDFAREASQVVTRRRIFLIKLDVHNLNANSYNALLKSKWFYERIDAEHILIFQTDTVACASSLFNIDEFEKYSYIGCPYDDRIGKGVHWGPKNSFYGVGGLSFRHRSACIACIDSVRTTPEFPEDVFFSNCMDHGFKMQKPEHGGVLRAFCSQNTFNQGSFGVHQPTLMSTTDQRRLEASCPETAPFFSTLAVDERPQA